MKERTVNITNFIGVYDNYIRPEECDEAIKLFEDANKFHRTVNRVSFEQASILSKKTNNILQELKI